MKTFVDSIWVSSRRRMVIFNSTIHEYSFRNFPHVSWAQDRTCFLVDDMLSETLSLRIFNSMLGKNTLSLENNLVSETKLRKRLGMYRKRERCYVQQVFLNLFQHSELPRRTD